MVLRGVRGAGIDNRHYWGGPPHLASAGWAALCSPILRLILIQNS